MRPHVLHPGPLLAVLVACGPALAQSRLGTFNADPSTVTVSGISSGGFMAVQLDVAYSSRFHGIAVFAGGPYGCAQGSVSTAQGACESGSGISVPSLIAYTDQQADAGLIDATSNLAGKPIYMFSGTQDTTVHPAVMDALQQYFQNYTSSNEITYNNTTAAAHAWISPDGPNSCGSSFIPYINNCGIDPESTFLGLFYGTLSPKSGAIPDAGFVEFDQDEFCGGSCSSISMDSTGWLYVPGTCSQGAPCRLVVALHGCLQYQGIIQQQLVKESGLDEWAEANDLLVLYPQATTGTGNPVGCWDWWGYTGTNYADRGAPQMQAIMAMVDRITGSNPLPGDGGTTSGDGGTQGASDGGRLPDGGVDGHPGGGCGCGSPGSPGMSSLLLLLALVSVWARRAQGPAER